MPNCYLCTDDKMEISKETFSRKDFQLPEEGFVFTCFNGAKKITPNASQHYKQNAIQIAFPTQCVPLHLSSYAYIFLPNPFYHHYQCHIYQQYFAFPYKMY